MSILAEPQAPEAGKSRPNGFSGPQHDITLTATRNGNLITVTGSGNWDLPKEQGATHFNFTLDDQSDGKVMFTSLDTVDNTTDCPKTGSGLQSSQITDVRMEDNSHKKRPNTASFKDHNSNPAKNGPMNVSYQWNFTCDAPYTVAPFDPIISNGGRN